MRPLSKQQIIHLSKAVRPCDLQIAPLYRIHKALEPYIIAALTGGHYPLGAGVVRSLEKSTQYGKDWADTLSTSAIMVFKAMNYITALQNAVEALHEVLALTDREYDEISVLLMELSNAFQLTIVTKGSQA